MSNDNAFISRADRFLFRYTPTTVESSIPDAVLNLPDRKHKFNVNKGDAGTVSH